MRIRTTLAFLLLAAGASAYVREFAGVPVRRTDNTAIQVYLNNQFVAGYVSPVTNTTVVAAGSDPAGALSAALDTWNTFSNANIHFLPLQTTAAGLDNSGSLMVVAIATSNTDISLLGGTNGGALAITEVGFTNNGVITSSNIMFNPEYLFGTTGPFTLGGPPYDLKAVLTHELGHSLGADHTNVLAGTMYPFAVGTFEETPSTDELAFVNAVYPSAATPASGTIGGTVTLTGGGTVANPLIALIDPVAGVTIGTIGNSTGTWSVEVPPGSYIVYAEYFNSIMPAGSYRVTAGPAFQPAVLGGAATPTLVTVSAGKTATANIAVNSGATTLAVPLLGVTAVNGPFVAWDEGGADFVPSGQSSDLLLWGAGFDSSLTDSDFAIYGPGITVHPGSVRLDPSLTVNGSPLLRVTVDVAARQSIALASIFVTKGTETLSLTGTLVITPSAAGASAAPQFTAQNVLSAASYKGSGGTGAVSPGGIYSIYAAPGTAGLGPATAVTNPPASVPVALAGVTVTFDGVAAPLFLVAGSQINLQAPFEIAGKTSTSVVVTYNGVASAPVAVPVLPEQPAFFTVTPLGADSIVTNQDGSLNSAGNPAAPGSYVTAWGTGIGKVSYKVVTGQGAPAQPGYTGNYSITIGNHAPVAAAFGGWTPGSIGLAQWTFQVPADSPAGKQTLTATDASTSVSTQAGTLYVQ